MGSWWRAWRNVCAIGVVGSPCLGLGCDGARSSGEESGGFAGSAGSSGSTGKGGGAGAPGAGGGSGASAGSGESGGRGGSGAGGSTSAGSTGDANGGTGTGGGSGSGAASGGEAGDSHGTGGNSGDENGGTGANTSGTSGSAGTGGAGEAWDAACDGVTNNGRCNDNVYEWCDYFTRSVMQLDCTPLGMTCRAESQPNEADTNGCVGEVCTDPDDAHCDGQLLYDCQGGEQVAIDCRKQRGPSTECEFFKGWPRCAMNHPCDVPSTTWCEGNLNVICTEVNTLYYQDCQRASEDGRCVPLSATMAHCYPPSL